MTKAFPNDPSICDAYSGMTAFGNAESQFLYFLIFRKSACSEDHFVARSRAFERRIGGDREDDLSGVLPWGNVQLHR